MIVDGIAIEVRNETNNSIINSETSIMSIDDRNESLQAHESNDETNEINNINSVSNIFLHKIRIYFHFLKFIYAN